MMILTDEQKSLLRQKRREQLQREREWFEHHDRTHSGPKAGVCAACGNVIPSYESRHYGDTGAVCAFGSDKENYRSYCYTEENKHLYPWYYTDG